MQLIILEYTIVAENYKNFKMNGICFLYEAYKSIK